MNHRSPAVGPNPAMGWAAAGRGMVLVGFSTTLVVLAAPSAWAADSWSTGGFGTGYGAVLFTTVHLLGFLVVGLWAGLHGASAVWQLPVTAAVGAVLAGVVAGAAVDLPYAEEGLYGSLILIGLLVAAAIRLPVGLAVVLVAVAAVFHGFPNGADPQSSVFLYWLGFGAGVLLATTAGIGSAGLVAASISGHLVRPLGVLVALVGVMFMLKLF